MPVLARHFPVLRRVNSPPYLEVGRRLRRRRRGHRLVGLASTLPSGVRLAVGGPHLTTAALVLAAAFIGADFRNLLLAGAALGCDDPSGKTPILAGEPAFRHLDRVYRHYPVWSAGRTGPPLSDCTQRRSAGLVTTCNAPARTHV